MNKRLNSVIFILCGTIVNVLLSLVFMGALIILVLRFREFFGQAITVVVTISFFLGIMLAMFVYQKLAAWVITRFGLEDKLDPLFKHRQKRK
jgi:ABC-type sugar transport system permease subunit